MQLALLSNHDSRREARYKVLLRGKMRAGGLPTEVCVRDVSSRGLLLQAATSPRPGTIVEVLVARRSIVGRVRWAKDRRFGIELNPPMSVDAFLAAAVNAPGGNEAAPAPQPIRRQKPHDAEAARRQSAQLQFAALIMLTLIAAVWMSSLIHEAANASSQTIATALRRSR